MKKTYDPQNIEQPLYKHWEKQGYFKPNGNTNCESFCIMIPPPNITGNLHMGHAFQQTIMDIMIRYQRMQGKNTLWQVGTDHAGIATQMVVERKIADEEGKNRQDYDRESFIKKIWQWKKESTSNIAYQIRRLGNSVNWDNERFTMDKGISNAVKEVFIRLYKENLIYRGKRLVNWDTKLCTAISDLEVDNREMQGSMWYIRYLLADGIKTFDGNKYVVIATTRPETLLGDTGVAVNPKDPRYNKLIGKEVILPLVNRRIPIIGDEHANITIGTGCVKITPAHDFNDYEVGRRHKLHMINILTYDGNIKTHAEIFDTNGNRSNFVTKDIIPKQFQKMERFKARTAIVNAINELGLLVDVKKNILTIPYGDRSGSIIEPMLTDQWYMRTAPLAKIAVEAVKKGYIKFIPKQYENMYFSWMKDIKDWCISRQLWWGHRIPAWYDNNNNIYVGHSTDVIRQENNLSEEIILHQDENVLDTWFSSALWTFSSLGWPENTKELSIFHPTNVIVSGFDIIFFWIARMIMLTMHFIKHKNGQPQVPFETVYITGLIRDEQGEKMSKSKGNVIDPLDLIDGISLENLLKKRTEHMMQPKLTEKIINLTVHQFPHGISPSGTDALRFTLAAIASTGRDINWNMNRLEGYRNFCNKLWNASRFVLLNTEGRDCGFENNEIYLSLPDRWILIELNKFIKVYRKAIDTLRFDIAANVLYDFIWNQFCDWYLELTKWILKKGNELALRGTRNTLVNVLEILLRLAHPIIPFITETIWQRIKILKNINDDTIMLQPFPQYTSTEDNIETIEHMEWIKHVIVTIRNIRINNNIVINKKIDVLLRNCSVNILHRIEESQNFILHMAKLKSLNILSIYEKGPASITKIIEGAELLIPITNLLDKTLEQKRLIKEIDRIDIEINKIKLKINNEKFLSKAPKIIITKEKKRLIELKEIKEKLIKQHDILSKV